MSEVDADMDLPTDVNSVRLMFPKKYLATEDLRGKEVALTIARVTRRLVHKPDNTKELVNVIHFEEMDKRPEHERKCWIVNVTNGNSIAGILDKPDPHDWPGGKIKLWPDMAVRRPSGGFGGIRVKAP